MAAPTLFAEGATATGVTTGVPSVTIPTHQADDILIVTAVFFTSSGTNQADVPTPTGWTLMVQQFTIDHLSAFSDSGAIAIFYRRATGAGTTVTLTRGSGWDTGTDTVFNARAYVVRGCINTGTPWDAIGCAPSVSGVAYKSADQNIPNVTVSGSERTVIIFGISSDNAAFAMTSSGWTAGTEDNDAGGLDSSFQTIRKENVSSSTTAQAATVSAPAQGGYGYFGVSFKPPLNPPATSHSLIMQAVNRAAVY